MYTQLTATSTPAAKRTAAARPRRRVVALATWTLSSPSSANTAARRRYCSREQVESRDECVSTKLRRLPLDSLPFQPSFLASPLEIEHHGSTSLPSSAFAPQHSRHRSPMPFTDVGTALSSAFSPFSPSRPCPSSSLCRARLAPQVGNTGAR